MAEEKFDTCLVRMHRLFEELTQCYQCENSHEGRVKAREIISDLSFYLKEGSRVLKCELRKLPKKKIVHFKEPKEKKNKDNDLSFD